ncbi:MAG: oligosaccharide flippase family protein [Ruminococcus sp.]|nr:oligosaccharide flippase family protein [Ruminococcus sp.]
MKFIKSLISRYKGLALPAKASMWFIICSVLQRGISFFTVPIFTRLMTTEQYGMYSTYLSWYSILIVFTSLNLFYGVFNNAMIKFENRRDEYISSMQGLVTVITFGVFVVYLLFRDKCNSLLGMSTPLVLLLFIELLFTPALQFWTVHNRFDFKYRKIVFVTLAKSLANPILGIVFVLNSEQKDLARILSTVLVEVIVCGTIAIYQFYKGKRFYNKEFWKYAVMFNIPLIPHYLSGTILNQGDRVMINQLCGSAAVAFYSVAYNLGQLMNIFTSAITSSFTPWIYQKIRKNDFASIPRVTNMLFVIMAGLVSLLMLFAPEILYIIASPEYSEAVYVIPPIAGSMFFVLLYNTISNVEFYYEVRIYVTIGSIASACLNVGLNWIFIRKFGYYAAGYTTLFCYIIYGLSHLIFSKIVARKNLGKVKIFDSKMIMLLSLYVIAVSLTVNYLYDYTAIRYLCVIAIAAVMIWKRKYVMAEIGAIVKKK